MSVSVPRVSGPVVPKLVCLFVYQIQLRDIYNF